MKLAAKGCIFDSLTYVPGKPVGVEISRAFGFAGRTVIDLAKRRGYAIVERAIMPEELEGFTECFLTGTAAEVTPVSEIGPYRFIPGEISRNLMSDYSAEVQPKHAIAAE